MLKTFKGVDSTGIVSRLRGNKTPSEVMPDWLGGWWEAKYPNGLGSTAELLSSSAVSYGVEKINLDGTNDSTFNTSGVFDETPEACALQSTGKLIVVGPFAALKNSSGTYTLRARICRLNTDGTLDTTFSAQASLAMTSATTNFSTFKLLIDTAAGANQDKIYLISVGFVGARRGLIRLNSDGSLDTTFPATGINFGTTGLLVAVTDIKFASDGNLLITGAFTSISINSVSTNCSELVKLNLDGTLNSYVPTRNGSTTTNGLTTGGIARYGHKLKQQSDGKILMVGYQGYYIAGVQYSGITRFNSDLTIDTSFTGDVFSTQFTSFDAVQQSTGKYIYVNSSTAYKGTASNYIRRLNSDGSFDSSFSIGTGFNNVCDSVIVLSGGAEQDKIVVTGRFTSYNGTPCKGIIKLNADGTVDSSFDLSANYNGRIKNITATGSKYFLTGGFTNYYQPTFLPNLGNISNDLVGNIETGNSYTYPTGPGIFMSDSFLNGSNIPSLYLNNIMGKTKSFTSTKSRAQVLTLLGKTTETNNPQTVILCATIFVSSTQLDACPIAAIDVTQQVVGNNPFSTSGPGIKWYPSTKTFTLSSIGGSDYGSMVATDISAGSNLENNNPTGWTKYFVVISMRSTTAANGTLKEHIRGLTTGELAFGGQATTSAVIFLGSVNNGPGRSPSGHFHGAAYWATDIGADNTELVANYFIKQYKR
jgi:uncharacterized delta-60 repeat protein